jgi:gliding motility-associatede transport system auxiliary component
MKIHRNEIFRTVGSLGAVMVLAGAIRYAIENEFTTFTKILLITGGALALLALVASYREIISYFSRRSSKLGANVFILGVAFLAILVFLNFLGYRHHKRFDWTSQKLYTLSGQTHKIVSGLTKDVDIIQFAKSPKSDFSDVMSEYSYLSPHIHFRVVDPQERPDLAKEYGVSRMGQVVVACGLHNEKLENTEEQDITSAILRVTRDTQKTICFIEGHGEKSITSQGADGYSTASAELGKEDYQTKSVNLVTSNGVPSDCDVVVDVGPTQAFFPQEAQMLEKYLDDGGKAMLLIDPDTDPKLDDIFNAWNINASNDTVIDASGVGRLFGTGPAVPLVTDYGDSPITRNFQRTMTFFPLARTVSLANQNSPAVKGTELLKTSPASFAVKKISGSSVKFDPKTDQRGPLSLGVAVEKKEGKKTGRVVVIGDSDFASNRWVSMQRNGDLFYNAVNWLSEESNLISIRPKSPENRRVDLTEAQQRGLSLLIIYILPLIVLLGGLTIWLKRR